MKLSILENAALWVIKASLFVVPFVPLVIAASLFFPYITGKAYLFRAVVEVAFFAWILLALFFPKYRPRKSPLLLSIGAFIIVIGLATIFSIDPLHSFWSNFERAEGMVTYLHLLAYFLVLTSVFTRQDWIIFFNLFVASGIIEGIYGLMQRLGYFSNLQGGPRVEGTIGNPAYLAAYLIFAFGFAALLWIYSTGKFAKWYYGLAAFLSLSVLYFTASRGPSLGLLLGSAVCILLYLLLSKNVPGVSRFSKKIAWAILGLLVVVPLALWLFRDSSFVMSSGVLRRLTTLSFTDTTIASRFTIWSMSFEGFKEHPILGWGPENYPLVFAKYFKSELWPQEPWFDRSHNIIFDWLINAGALGLFAYLSIFVAALYSLWRHHRRGALALDVAILFTGLFIAYGFQNIFVFDNMSTYLSFFAMLAFIDRLDGDNKIVSENKKVNFNYIPLVATILTIFFGLSLYFFSLRLLFANSLLIDAMRSQNSDYKLAYEYYKKVLSYNARGAEEATEQFFRFAVAIAGVQNVENDFKLEVIQHAINLAEDRIKKNPLDVRGLLFLSGILQQTSLVEQTFAVLNKAIELSPQKQQIYFELGDLYFKQKNFAKAVQVLEKAFKLDERYNGARVNLAAAYILNGNIDKADKLLLEKFGTSFVAEPLLVSVYMSIKNYPRLIEVRKKYVEGAPENVGYRLDLARAYAANGNKTLAITELKKVIELDPNQKVTFEDYIDKVKKGEGF